MSEEEIIKILNSYTTDLYHNYKGDVILKAIRGLLDLYNKEKEMNKELKEFIKEHPPVIPMPKEYKNTEGNLADIVTLEQKEYISKDKIQEKIKELLEEE